MGSAKMATDEVDTGQGSEYTPNFELSHRDVIHEDNWSEYEAMGFRPVPEPFGSGQAMYGVENIYSGDAYDYDARRPLRHKPGTSMYTSPEGLERAKRQAIEHRKWMDQHGFTP